MTSYPPMSLFSRKSKSTALKAKHLTLAHRLVTPSGSVSIMSLSVEGHAYQGTAVIAKITQGGRTYTYKYDWNEKVDVYE